jgi:hypothetical protein
MNLLTLLGIGVVLVWAYILWGRAFIIAHYPSAAGFIAAVDAIYGRSRTTLVSIGYWLAGALTVFHDLLAEAGLDWTPLQTQITNALGFIPENMRGLVLGVFLILTGVAFQWLRAHTAAPGSLTPPGRAT